MPAAVVAIVVSEIVAVEVIGAAVAEAILGATVSSATATAIGAGVVAAGSAAAVTLASGGDVSDALQNAVVAGAASVLGGVVSNVVAGSVSAGSPAVITNALSNAAGSATYAAVSGGDVGSAALMGLAGGAGATLGRELGTVLDYQTDPFSEQTAILQSQEAGMGTSGGVGAAVGTAAGQIAAGSDPTGAALAAITKALREQIKSYSTPVGATPPTETEGATPSPQEISIPDQIGQDYTSQDLQISPENLASFQQNLLQMQQEGTLPAQWQIGPDNTFTFTADDGSTITINEAGDILDFTYAPTGALLSDLSVEGQEPSKPKPLVREVAISGGGRVPQQSATVRNLGQALAPPLFPTSPAAGLTAVGAAGEIESGGTGKERKDVWNEASLRLKDALGI